MKKWGGEFSIVKFVKFDIRSLSYNNYLIIDMLAIEEKTDVIIENLIAIKSLYDMRIVLFADEIEIEDLKKIVEETKIYNIITETTIEEIKRETLVCFSPNGMTKEYISSKFSSEYGFDIVEDTYSFADKIKIAVAGSMERIGTTTISMNIASYLASIGATVSYTEGNKSKHLTSIHKYLFANKTIKGNHFKADGVDYYFNFNIPATDCNFHLIDFGMLSKENINIFGKMDIKILCGGVRPYEIPRLRSCIKALRVVKDYNLLIPKEDIVNIKNSIPNFGNCKIHKIIYSESLFDGSSNKKIWDVLLGKYLMKNQGT